MVTGLPKAGKTNFLMWLAAELALPTLYFSADSSPFTASTRLAAWATGHTVDVVGVGMGGPGADYYSQALTGLPLHWCFDSSPSTEDLVDELDAYVEAYDAFPEIIVVDNLMNVQASEEYAGQLFVMKELHSLARLTGATVFVLHHCSESGIKDTTIPPPRSAIQGKVSQLPELIFTVALEPTSRQFRIACVGNRSGPQFPDGKTYITLDSEVERLQFRHFVPRPAFGGNYGYNDSED